MDNENDSILNYFRYGRLQKEVYTRIMLMVYKQFYDWPDGCPHKLADHLDEIPANHQKPLKKLLNAGEITKVKAMKEVEQKLREYDITFYFKLIQVATDNGLLKPLNDNVWNNNCPQGRKGELEHLLFLIKDDRNKFCHENDQFLNLKDEDIESHCVTIRKRILSIIKQTGEKVGEDQTVIDEISKEFMDNIESIRPDENEVLKILIQNNYLIPKLQELERCFKEELKSYCCPNFNLDDGTSISTEELLSDDDSRLICINAETGYGKTSFTKFVQHKLLSENVGDDDLRSRKIPIRIACRNITGRNVSEFLEDEIPNSGICVSTNISSVKKFLERFNIWWIIDGYDEKNAKFDEFFDSLLKTLSSIHKIILTSRPNSLKELKDKLKEKEVREKLKEVREVSIKSFDDKQLRQVAKNYLGEDKVADFESAIERLNDETWKFVKIPINLSLCLELWPSDPTIFDEEITSIYQLYDKMLEKHRNLLVSRHKGMAYGCSEEDLKCGVTLWFSYLCEVVAESAFSYDLSISEAQKAKLMKKAKLYGLIGTYCLSTFFNTDKSPVETNYFITHKTQKEVLSCVYLKECDDDALKAVAQQTDTYNLFNYSNSFEHIKFLMECCNRCEFARIFVPLLKIYLGLQRPDCLLQIKDENISFCDALKTQFKASGQSLVLHVYNDNDVDDLLKVLQYLMPVLNSFKLIIDKEIKKHKEIIEYISKYKDPNSFYLKLRFNDTDVFVRIIQMYTNEGNQIFIKELDLNHFKMREWTEEMKKELFKLESLNFLSFYVWGYNYSSSILGHFATEEIDSKEESENIDSIVIPPSSLSRDVHTPQTTSTTTNPVSLQTTTSTSLAAFDHCTNLHFNIWDVRDSSKVISDLVKVNSKFPSISVDLYFCSEAHDLPDNLLRRYLSSSVQVKRLQIRLDLSKFPNVMKLVNYGHIETLELWSFNEDESSSVSEFESFFAICDFDKMNKIKLIYVKIWAKSPSKQIYNKLPSDLLKKTELDVSCLCKSSAEMKIVVDSKQFKRIEIWTKYFSASEIDQLKSISKSIDIKDSI